MKPPKLAEAGWEVQHREALCVTPHLAVYEERVASPHQPDGVNWLTVDRKAGVVIAPRLSDGRWLLIHEDRIPPRRSFWCFPAGQIDAGAGDGLATAQQELLEETGHVASGEWLYLGHMFTSPGFTNEELNLWFADAVKPSGSHVAEQAIREMRAVSREEMVAWVNDGTICDANTLSALTQLFLRGLF